MKAPFLLFLLPVATQAATLVTDAWIVSTAIPDNSPIGLSVTRSVVSTITSITEVRVNLDLEGGWSGDLFGYLVHASGFSVLLNRPGRTAADSSGSAANRLFITLADAGAADVHTAIPAAGFVTGIFQPDARNVDPSTTTDTDLRTAHLSSFNGLNANGDWTLFLADVAAGDTMTLNSWSISITGVPEPSVALLGVAGLSVGLLRRRQDTPPHQRDPGHGPRR